MKPFYLLILLIMFQSVKTFNFRQVQTTPSVTTINTISNYTFQYDRTVDNTYTLTSFNTQAVSSTANVTINFPSDFTSIASATCLSITVNSLAVNTFSCDRSGNSIIFRNAFASVTNLFVTGVVIIVGNVLNPAPAIYSGSFSGTIGIDVAVAAGTGVQLTPAYFTSCGITFSPNFVYSTSTMIVSLTPTNQLAPGATITIQFPRSTWLNDISNTLLPITTTMACSNYSANINSGISCTGSSNTLITASNILQTNLLAPFAFGVSNFLSPPSNQPSDAINITSYINGFKVDNCSVYPSGLVANNFFSFTITPVTPMTVNSLVALRFSARLSMTINQNDYFSVTFPSGTSFQYNNIYGISFYTLPPTISGQTVVIYNQAGITTTFTQNRDYIVTLQFFQAPPSTLATNPIVFSVLRSGYPIMVGSASLTALPGSLNGTATPSLLRVWAVTSYTFNITINDPLSSLGMIQIFLPSVITWATSSISCAQISGVGFNNLPTCSFFSSLNSILLTNINGSSSTIAAQTFILTINSLTNPPDTSTTSAFTITTYYTNSQSGITDTGSVTGVTATVGTIAVASVLVTPSSYLVFATGVSYTITFNNTYIIPQNGYVSIQIPTDISITLASLTSYCKFAINSATFISTACVGQIIGSVYQINFTAIAVTTPVAAQSIINLQIATICTNPSNTRIISPFSITTYSSDAPIETLSGITVQMTTPAAFYVTSVVRASQQNSALTPYTLTLKQQAALPAGTLLLITLPSSLAMTLASVCTDLSGNPLNCTLTSYQALTVTLNSIAAGAQYGVIITNMRNPPSYRPTSGSFTVITMTADLISTYAQSSFTAGLSNSAASVFASISYSFTPGAYVNSESLVLTVTPSGFVVPTYMLISLAPSLTVNALSCNSFVGFGGSCSLVSGSPSSINVTGMSGSSQIGFTVTGFTSPTGPVTDSTSVSSYESSFLVDQNSSFIRFSLNCVLPCRTCSSSNLSACLSCYNNVNISPLNLYYPATSQCLSACPPAFYSSPSLTCLSCSATCLTCSVTFSNCTTCNTTSAYPALNLTNSTGACLSACPLYYYLSSAVTPTQCVLCDQVTYHCSTCSAINLCLSCVATYFLSNGTCTNTCPSNTTIANSGTWKCDLCSTQCATCLGNVNNCSSCSSSAASYNGQCLTECPAPLVINAGTCASCDPSCRTCFFTSTNCTGCVITSTIPYLSVSNTSVGSCLQTCPYSFYGDLANGLCVSCVPLGIGCNNCSSPTTCNTCNTGYIFYLNTCLLVAPLGFFNSSGFASPCSSQCATCQGLAGNCTSCLGNLSLSGTQCVFTCPSGQVGLSQVCTNCSVAASCMTCLTTATFCTSCIMTSPAVYLSQGNCVTGCPNYTYPDDSTRTCAPCTNSSHCEKCSTQYSCVSCVTGYYLYNATCGASCPSGFIGLNRLCAACINNCLSCVGSTSICSSCQPGYYLYNATSKSCVNPCPAPLFMDNFTMTCTGCSSTCATCANYTTQCLSCPSGLVLQGTSCSTNCSIGYYPLAAICTLCPSSCSACLSALLCTQCATNFYLYVSSCLGSCPASHPIVNVNGGCSACTNVYCVSCNATNYCAACYFPQVLVQGTCASSCPASYVLDSNGTACVYMPYTPGSNSSSVLTASLTNSPSVFPVPFTIGAAFLAVACLMSRFQHERTFVWGALYGFWGLLEWGAVSFLLLYFWEQGGNVFQLGYLLVAGGLGFLYLLNVVFLAVQAVSIRGDRRLQSWMAGTLNSCCFRVFTLVGLLTSNKVTNLLFCKLFAFPTLSAKLESPNRLRSYYMFGFFAFISSLAVLAGTAMLLGSTSVSYTQLSMAQVDVVVLTLLELIVALCHTCKPQDFFQDTDEDGIQVNRRVSSFDEVFNEQVQPSYGENSHKSYLEKHDSARKIQAELLSQYSINSRRSYRDISIQADQILGERSLISRLGTETISDLSGFQNHDISVQMSFQNNDVSVQMIQQKEAGVDVSVGGQVIQMFDVSINGASLHQHDVSVAAEAVIFNDASIDAAGRGHDISVSALTQLLQDVSVQQTALQHNQASVQYMQPNRSISVQFDQPQQNEISVQYVPLYTDQTVHMTREQQSFAVQCNAEHQNVSVQYSAKPQFEQHGGALHTNSSLELSEQEEPSDLDLQRRMLEGGIAPLEEGLRPELEVDIVEKLERKERELQQMQAERWQREKEEAMRQFQEKVEVRMQESPVDRQEQQDRLGREYISNQPSQEQPSSLMHTQEIIEINLPPRLPPRPPSSRPQDRSGQMSSHGSNQLNKSESVVEASKSSRPHSARTEQQLINMLSGDPTQQEASRSGRRKGRAQIQSGNFFLQEEEPQMLEEEPMQLQPQLAQNTMQLFPADKSRSTANNTGRYGNTREPILEDSSFLDMDRSEEDAINAGPLLPQTGRPFRQEEVDHADKTNLNRFLQKKRANVFSANHLPRNQLKVEDDDALLREIQQRPLPPQRSQQLYSQASINNGRFGNQFEFEKGDRMEDALSVETRKVMSRGDSRKKLPTREALIQRGSKGSSKGYLRETYTSDEKRKSLQKIYLQKMAKK